MRQTLLALALLAAGGVLEGQASNSTVAPAASPTPAPRKAPPPPRPAGKAKAAPPALKLELEQDGRAVPVQDHEALLSRAPFTLLVTLPDKDGVLVSEFQLTEQALAAPEAFVAALKDSIEAIEESEL